MKILNYTPHEITLVGSDGASTTFPSVGIARCNEVKRVVGSAGGYPLYSISYGDLSGLPAQTQDTILIVSAIAAQAAKAAGRADCYIVADTIRNEKGQIVGAKGLAVV